MTLFRMTCCLCVLVLSLAAFAAVPHAHAATAPNPATLSLGSGSFAAALFSSYSPDGCVQTMVYVAGFKTASQGSPTVEGVVSPGIYNYCTNTPLLSTDFTQTSAATFKIAQNLTSASLSGTIPVYDYVSGSTINISVNMTWTASGTLSRFNSTELAQTGGYKLTSTVHGTLRPATVTGSVTDATTNFTPPGSAQPDWENLEQIRAMTLQISAP